MQDTCTYTFENVTPAIASQWLTLNRDNRKLRPKYVEELAGVISRGEWQPNNGECVTFDEAGYLVSGQHRLRAVQMARRAIWTHVCRGIPVESKITVDTGRKRTIGDVLGYLNFPYATNLGAAIRLVKIMRNSPGPYMIQQSGGMLPAEAMSFIDAEPLIQDSVVYSRAWRKNNPALTDRSLTALHYVMNEINAEDALIFFDRLASGIGLTEGDPILVLKNAFTHQVNNTRKVRQENLMAWTLLAFNKWRNGERVQLLRYTQRSEWPHPKAQAWDTLGISREEHLTGQKPVYSQETEDARKALAKAKAAIIVTAANAPKAKASMPTPAIPVGV